MASNDATLELDGFLAAHAPVDEHPAFAPGEMFGDWRVTAFLGRGGSGKVYRVVHVTLGTAAALKVCVRDSARNDARDSAVCARFRQEAKLLSKNTHPAFPRFLGFGERESRPWYVMELLEHRPLPTAKRDIVRFLLAVASGVGHLHSLGLVHRDIKPGNILWRDSSPVLIDLGLAKDMSAARGHAGESLSIVDGKAVGVGTPRYAAPEQLTGDEISPATDVYALGMLANDCFAGKPPRRWQRIIQRATAAIPAQRYATVDEFIRAVRWLRVRNSIVITLMAILAVSAIVCWMRYSSLPEEPSTTVADEKATWHDLCINYTTNIVTPYTKVQPRSISAKEHKTLPANAPRFDVTSWAETNNINAVQVNLDGRTLVFGNPIDLDAGREYWIVGPGVLDAQFSISSTATIHIVNCIFRNRTSTSPQSAGIDYVLDGGSYLNFTDLPETEAMKLEAGTRVRSNSMSEGRRWWRIKGPDNLQELIDEDNRSSYPATKEAS